MMRKLLVLFLLVFLLVPTVCLADADLIGEESLIVSASDPCANLGTWDLYWDGDHPSGFDYYCVAGGTGQWSITEAVSTIVGAAPTGMTGNVLLINEQDEHLSKSPTGFWASAEGVIQFDFYGPLNANHYVFEGRKDLDEEFYIQVGSTGVVRLQLEDPTNGTQYVLSSAYTVSANTTTTIKIGWSNGAQYIKIGANPAETFTLTYAGYTSEPAIVYFGVSVYTTIDTGGGNIDKIYMSNTYTAP